MTLKKWKRFSVEKFDLLYSVLLSFYKAGLLENCVLIGSWCQDFYRQRFGNPFQIPAITTTDADLLIPKRLVSKYHLDVASIMVNNGFVIDYDRSTGLMIFIHEDFKFEFITDAGAKSDESIYDFKNLNLNAQELRFMSIPLTYNYVQSFKDISVRLPEPEAFALHKLIVSGRRSNPIKKIKDIETVRGLFEYFETKPEHISRLLQIYNEFIPGWKKKVDSALKEANISFPSA